MGVHMTTKNLVHECILGNGLKIILKEDHRAPAAIFQVWYKIGSGYETNGSTGISHILEHMMFRGSQRYSMQEQAQLIAKNGGQQNAFTSLDFTAYHELMSANKIALSFQLEADRMHALLLREKDFKKEITVIMEERFLTVEDVPQNQAMERFLAAAHVTSPYHHPTIGWRNDIENTTVQDLRRWYKTWYVPNNAIIVVVGDALPKNIFNLAKKHFGSLRPRPLPILKPQFEAPHLGARSVSVKAHVKVPWLIMGYNTPVMNTVAENEKWEPYALLILNGIFAGCESSRLQKNLIRKQQIAISASCSYSPFNRLDNIWMLFITPSNLNNIEKVKQSILEEISHVQNKLASNQELEKIKILLLADQIFQKDSISHQAYDIGSFECVGISWREAENNIFEQIQSITPLQVQAVAKKYLIPERLTICSLEPLSP
jgi:zinc protease